MATSSVADPMSRVTFLLLAAALASLALAGCSDDPPAGELVAGAGGVVMDGNIIIDYTERVRPAEGIPVLEDQCPPAGTPSQIPQCVEPSSSFTSHFMVLPQPEGTYELVLANDTGSLPIGALVPGAAGMYELNQTLPEDYAGDFDRIELRMGDFVLATSSTAEGTQTFALALGLEAIGATGTYAGRVLNVTVSGLPDAGNFVGRLYTCDPGSGLLTATESFPVANGANEHTAELNIGDYAEFHIHAGSSLINLYKTTIGEPQGCTSAPAGATATT